LKEGGGGLTGAGAVAGKGRVVQLWHVHGNSGACGVDCLLQIGRQVLFLCVFCMERKRSWGQWVKERGEGERGRGKAYLWSETNAEA
jgi:hypothetical protein